MVRLAVNVVALALCMLSAPSLVVGQDQVKLRPDEVHLLDPGSEPRVTLRYAWTQGQSETVSSETTTRMAITVDGVAAADMTMPATLVMATRAVEVRPDGSARFAFTITRFDMEIRPTEGGEPQGEVEESLVQADALLRPSIESLVGAGGTLEVDAVGHQLRYDIDYPEDFPVAFEATMTQTLKVAAEPLPAEPVGVGAVWQMGTTGAWASGAIEVVATSTLISVDDRQLVIVKRIGGAPSEESTESPSASVGDASDRPMEIDGRAVSLVDLDQLMPTTEGELAVQAVAREGFTADDGQGWVTVVSEITVKGAQRRLDPRADPGVAP